MEVGPGNPIKGKVPHLVREGGSKFLEGEKEDQRELVHRRQRTRLSEPPLLPGSDARVGPSY